MANSGPSDAPLTSQGGLSNPGVNVLDDVGGGIVAELPSGVFAAIPLPDCPHLPRVEAVPSAGVNTNQPCATCDDPTENWVCLTCYAVFCSRYVNGHGVEHFQSESHPMALSFSDLSAWCYECEAYVHNEVLTPAKETTYASKFGQPAPPQVSRPDLHPTNDAEGWNE